MNREVSFHLFFPTGIEDSHLHVFVSTVLKESSFKDLRVFYKEDIDLASTIFAKVASATVGLLIYDGGGFMRIDGNLESAIKLLTELDRIIEQDIVFYVQGSQQNNDRCLYPRGATTAEIAEWLAKSKVL